MDPNAAFRRLRSMTAADDDPTIAPDDLGALLLAARRTDRNGAFAVTDAGVANAAWVPTYDLHWAAAEGWLWKAGCAANRYAVVSDATSLSRHQVHQHCLNMEKVYRARQQPVVLRVRGQLVEDRTRIWSQVPWWWSLAA